MRSIIVNYLNRRSSVHLVAESAPPKLVNETHEKLKQESVDDRIEMFNDIKFIDDNETDSASMLSCCSEEPSHLAYHNIPSGQIRISLLFFFTTRLGSTN